jgi:hypothetical protein
MDLVEASWRNTATATMYFMLSGSYWVVAFNLVTVMIVRGPLEDIVYFDLNLKYIESPCGLRMYLVELLPKILSSVQKSLVAVLQRRSDIAAYICICMWWTAGLTPRLTMVNIFCFIGQRTFLCLCGCSEKLELLRPFFPHTECNAVGSQSNLNLTPRQM